jgi:hypothetical protein
MALKDLTHKENYVIEYYTKYLGWRTWGRIAWSMEQALEEKKIIFPNHQMPKECRIIKFIRGEIK